MSSVGILQCLSNIPTTVAYHTLPEHDSTALRLILQLASVRRKSMPNNNKRMCIIPKCELCSQVGVHKLLS